MAEPAELVGSFVVEVGVRQVWPFLTFCDDRSTPPTEHRLYIESGIEVSPPRGTAQYNSVSTRWQTLFVLDGRTVGSVAEGPRGDLRIEFETGEALVVFGEQDAQASGAPWWIGLLQLTDRAVGARQPVRMGAEK